MRKVIIVGSSRNDGETQKVAERLAKYKNWDIVNLCDYQISYFDYGHHNEADDYLELMKTLIEKYDVFIFATPVYWYSMSGIMKVFFDRITDLLTIEKELGRELRKKKMAVITSSGGGNLGDQFWLPFSSTAEYLGMGFIGGLHTVKNKQQDLEVKTFVDEIEEKSDK